MPVLELASDRLVAELSAARAQSDSLFNALTPEAMYRRPIAERHRVIFYLGHLDGFDCHSDLPREPGLKSPDSGLDDLFQAGIDPDAGHLPKDAAGDWPTMEQSSGLRGALSKACGREFGSCAGGNRYMALEHRLMHLETLAYMFHNFPLGLKNGPGTGIGESSRRAWIAAMNGVRYRPASDAREAARWLVWLGQRI